MKWFIKVLRHYADFSGRARRQEYWMFFLFNMIFSFAWAFILMFIVALVFKYDSEEKLLFSTMAINLSFGALMMLPSLAVSVRRLHDLGKSGWMMLIALIPIAGGIWLLVLLLTEGENKANEYGPNPKTSTEIFGEQARLRSAGIALIFATAVIILTGISSLVVSKLVYYTSPYFITYLYYIPLIIILIAGVFLLNENKIYEVEGNKKSAVILLLTAAGVYLLLLIFNVVSSKNSIWIIRYFTRVSFDLLFYLSIAFFAVSLLLSPRNKRLIRISSILTIVFSGIKIIMYIYYALFYIRFNNELHTLLDVYNVLLPASLIVLSCTFLSGGKGNPQFAASENDAFHDNNRMTRIDAAQATRSSVMGNAGNVAFAREDRQANKVWRIYKAPSKADATAFLSKQQVNRPFYYIVVETREGNFGKDIEGFYQE